MLFNLLPAFVLLDRACFTLNLETEFERSSNELGSDLISLLLAPPLAVTVAAGTELLEFVPPRLLELPVFNRGDLLAGPNPRMNLYNLVLKEFSTIRIENGV